MTPTQIYSKVKALLEANWRESDWFFCDSSVVAHYAMKAMLCGRFSPRRIIEIGTRCGYSVLAFHAVAPRASFLCIDACVDDDSLECLAHAKHIIARYEIEADIVVANSHDLRSLPPACFAHIDGDHSYDGALSDLRLVGQCRAILADDYCNTDVARAVQDYAKEQNRHVDVIHDGLRKVALLA